MAWLVRRARRVRRVETGILSRRSAGNQVMGLADSVRRSRRLVFTHGGGRFANQLMLFGHLIGLVEDCPELYLCNFSFWEYAKFCEGTAGNPRCMYPSGVGKGDSLVRRMHGIVNSCGAGRIPRRMHDAIGRMLHFAARGRSLSAADRKLDLADPAVRERLLSTPTTFLSGWNVRDWPAFSRHADKLRAFLKPPAHFRDAARDRVDALRANSPVVIGLLMRQTDYRQWRGGEYFLSSAAYRGIIDQIWARFGENAQILVTSDEAQEEAIFLDPRIAWGSGTFGKGHFMESFSELGECDLIVSVPSTFAAWAAFLGGRPLLCLPAKGVGFREEQPMPLSLIDARLHPLFQHAVY